MAVTINIYYTGEKGSAREFVREMLSGGFYVKGENSLDLINSL